MAAGKYDFSIEQGASFSIVFTYKDNNDVPVDLTGWCARLTWLTNTGITQVFTSENTDPALYSIACDSAGNVTFKIPAIVTNNYNFTNAKYDLELESTEDLYSGGGKVVVRLLYGKVTLNKRYSQYATNLECQ